MKKLLFTFFLTAAFFYANAQTTCVPDSVTYKYTGIYPKKLPDATTKVAYNTTIQFKFPKDTSVSGISGHIDSATIVSVVNKNNIFTYKCSNASCTYKGGQNGCVVLSGTPTDKEVGTDTLHVNVLLYVTTGFGPVQAPYSGNVTLNVVHNSAIFYQEANNSFSVDQNFPNPFSSGTEISFNMESAQPAILKVSNELGQMVYLKKLSATAGQNTVSFNRENLPSGIYFYNIQSGQNTITRRMVIKD
jgi:hypothetical protein